MRGHHFGNLRPTGARVAFMNTIEETANAILSYVCIYIYISIYIYKLPTKCKAAATGNLCGSTGHRGELHLRQLARWGSHFAPLISPRRRLQVDHERCIIPPVLRGGDLPPPLKMNNVHLRYVLDLPEKLFINCK